MGKNSTLLEGVPDTGNGGVRFDDLKDAGPPNHRYRGNRMAYLVFRFKETELGRWALRDPVVVGRSPECSISIRDIMLSRRHCRIERRGRDWIVTDLASKNGTFIEDGINGGRRRQCIYGAKFGSC